MTEEEAKTRRCCGPDGCGETYGGDARWCAASACMAWRWDFSPEQVAYRAKEAPQAYAEGKFIARGRCGLAGAPQ